ncbi:hypothetical protein SAMN05421823_104137 [Catalinimonas alkaloidigena]|uniref:Uncharacterized protein n=1 Tax=Catalinimonas alkaloidigena TaxID=1075417 RepID=A0A1G9GK50_9BACT|nr:DUF6348 family protein [Catalinimonas alkaloidigena]SDL01058.1 hypothetical protein SAMN05421823_104137 [Catalinimonas alkaloidigena]
MLRKYFKRKQKTSEINDERGYININTHVSEMLVAHGVSTKNDNNKIVINLRETVEFETRVYVSEYLNGIQTRFDLKVKLEDGNEYYESFGDIGKSIEESINNNLQNFSRSSLHVIIDALNDTQEYVECETWEIGRNSFKAYIGKLLIKSVNDRVIEFPKNLLDEIQRIITEKDLEERYYFIRFFYAHNQGESLVTEFMINNIKQEMEQIQLSEKLNWFKSNSFYSMRQFLILKKL